MTIDGGKKKNVSMIGFWDKLEGGKKEEKFA